MKVYNCLKLGITRSIYLNNDNRMFRGGKEQNWCWRGWKRRQQTPETCNENCIAQVGWWEVKMTASRRQKEEFSGRKNWICRYEKSAKKKGTQKSKLNPISRNYLHIHPKEKNFYHQILTCLQGNHNTSNINFFPSADYCQSQTFKFHLLLPLSK